MQLLCNFYAKFIAISLFCGLMAVNSSAWAQLYPIKMGENCAGQKWPIFDVPPVLPFEQRIDSSSFVFGGLVVSIKYIDHNERIYTCATILVHRIYKGDFIADTVEVLSYYGRNLNDTRLQCIGDIRMGKGGIFFVNQNNVFDTQNLNGRLRFRLAFLNGGMADWDEIGLSMHIIDNAEECFEKRGFEKVSDGIKKITKKCIDVEGLRKKKSKVSSKSAINISSFEPASIAAGHLESPTEFVINGSGFGETKGKVYFRDANVPSISGTPFEVEYVAINPKFITYWQDDEIIISAIPTVGYATDIAGAGIANLGSAIGSGKIAVEIAGGDPLNPTRKKSSTSLTVTHAILNHVVLPTPWSTNPELQEYYELHNHDFVNDSPNNYDFEFVYDPEFYNNKPAYAAFHRALDTWRKKTGVRFTERCGEVACNEVTDNQVAVLFDTETTTSAGCYHIIDQAIIQAITYHEEAVCDNKAYFTKKSIIFDPEPEFQEIACNWDYDSENSTENDLNFENYALHELGHLLGLDHVVNKQQLMTPSTPPGKNKLSSGIDLNNIRLVTGNNRY